MVKNPSSNAGEGDLRDMGSIPGLGRSPGEGKGNSLQYSCLENPIEEFGGLQSSSVQLLSHVQLFATPWTAARQTTLSTTNSLSLLKLMSIELVMPSNTHPLSSPSPPAFNLSQHQALFQRVSSSHQMAKVLELQHQFFQ